MQDDLFSKIENETLREKIYDDMVKSSTEIEVQLKDNTLLRFKSYKRLNNLLIIYRELTNQPLEQDVIVTFNQSPEKYFMKSSLIQKDKTCQIQLTNYLYKVQRRKNFRLTLPRVWEPLFHCSLHETMTYERSYDLFDISGGGFSFEYAPGEFSPIPDGSVEGNITIRKKLDIPVKAKVKHTREVGTKAYPRTRVGLEFQDLPQKHESEIMAILMEAHREIFSRLK